MFSSTSEEESNARSIQSMERQSEDRKYARGPLDTPSHRIGLSSLAPDGAHFAEEGPRAASEPVLRNPSSRSGTINSTLGSVIGGGLQAINTVLSDISNFEQTVIWPKQAIAQALGMA